MSAIARAATGPHARAVAAAAVAAAQPTRALVPHGYDPGDPYALRKLADVASRALVQHHHFASLLDAMTPAQRHVAVRLCGGVRRLRAVYESVAGAERVQVDDVVGPDKGALVPVRYLGKNSLPMFTKFEKHFCRASAENGRGPSRELWGFNKNWYSFAAAHGYYTAYDSDSPLGGVAIDYDRYPPGKAPGWPARLPNGFLIGMFIWPGMVDYLRRVSRDVFIGVAVRYGKLTQNYFMLSRAD